MQSSSLARMTQLLVCLSRRGSARHVRDASRCVVDGHIYNCLPGKLHRISHSRDDTHLPMRDEARERSREGGREAGKLEAWAPCLARDHPFVVSYLRKFFSISISLSSTTWISRLISSLSDIYISPDSHF